MFKASGELPGGFEANEIGATRPRPAERRSHPGRIDHHRETGGGREAPAPDSPVGAWH
jgi:hypothetical protein